MNKSELILRLEDVLGVVDDDEEQDYDDVTVSDFLVEAGLHTLPTCPNATQR